ncbi:MAG: glycosyltransferase family A protein [Verrucomicrobiota bacterium]
MSSVALVIPARNRNKLLVRAMRSVRHQVLKPDDVFVIDDGSDEEMGESRNFARQSGFRWIRLPKNCGVSAARNVGVNETSAEWICFLDSDDEWLPDKLNAQLKWHRDHPECRISQVREAWFRDNKRVKQPPHWRQKAGDLFSDSVLRCSIGPSCVMLARSLWDEVGGFDETLRVCEDYDLWLRICAHSRVGLVGSEPLVRKHAGHVGQLSVETKAMDRFRIHALLKALLSHSLSDEQRRLVEMGIGDKSLVMEQGASKRGARERATFYRDLAGVNWNEQDPSEIKRWLAQSSRFLAD